MWAGMASSRFLICCLSSYCSIEEDDSFGDSSDGT